MELLGRGSFLNGTRMFLNPMTLVKYLPSKLFMFLCNPNMKEFKEKNVGLIPHKCQFVY